jgi:hypothetical protein
MLSHARCAQTYRPERTEIILGLHGAKPGNNIAWMLEGRLDDLLGMQPL